MKTTNRTGHKTGKKSTSAQSANTLKKAPGKTPKEEFSLRIVAQHGETPLGFIVLPQELSSELFSRATKEGSPHVVNLIHHILREESKTRLRGHFPSTELEHVVGRACALLGLLNNKLQDDLANKINSRSPEYNALEALKAGGYFQLIDNVQNDLRHLFDSIFAWLQAKTDAPVVAPAS